MITTQHTQEALCRAFVIALAARAGASYEIHRGFDYGVDCTFRHVQYSPTRRRHIESGFSMDVQLKSTTRWSLNRDNNIVYDLEAKTWNDVVERDAAAAPLYVAILCLHSDEQRWVHANERRMVMRNCCYFYQPAGPICEATQKRIFIPRANLLTPDRIQSLLRGISAAARRGTA